MPRHVGGFLLCAALLSSGAQNQPATSDTMTHPLIPVPSSIAAASDGSAIGASTTIRVDGGNPELLRLGRYFADWIGIAAAAEPLRVEPTTAGGAAGGIRLQLGEVSEPGDEAYELTSDRAGITIKARHPAGVFYGLQTLRQLLPPFLEHEAVRFDPERPIQAPAVRIADSPRFIWRGAMLDVARHFLTVDDVKRYIDLMALHKLNRLHLHLADDQGWRIEIKSWPNLTKHGGSTEVGGGPGGYYSQAQYADLVSYARDRYITVVPEIDMPGHTNAALSSYPDLNCDGKPRPLYTGIEVGFSSLCVDKEVTYKFITDVVGEIAALTSGPYFHIGGDEVKTLTPAQYAQFVERVQTIGQATGKQIIGWDEIAQAPLMRTTIVQHWRPETTPAQAVRQGAKVIMSLANRTYLDMQYDKATPIGLHWAAYIDVQDAYDWDPATIAAGVPESALLGIEAPLWTETVANIRDAEYLAFPRLAALAEVGWSRMDKRRWEDFRRRLGAQAPRWSVLGINFYRSPKIPWQ
jgi:hexosaminidase